MLLSSRYCNVNGIKMETFSSEFKGLGEGIYWEKNDFLPKKMWTNTALQLSYLWVKSNQPWSSHWSEEKHFPIFKSLSWSWISTVFTFEESLAVVRLKFEIYFERDQMEPFFSSNQRAQKLSYLQLLSIKVFNIRNHTMHASIHASHCTVLIE